MEICFAISFVKYKVIKQFLHSFQYTFIKLVQENVTKFDIGSLKNHILTGFQSSLCRYLPSY